MELACLLALGILIGCGKCGCGKLGKVHSGDVETVEVETVDDFEWVYVIGSSAVYHTSTRCRSFKVQKAEVKKLKLCDHCKAKKLR